MPDTFDPFTAAHQAIFAALKNHAGFSALVQLGNFADTTDPLFQQFKPATQAGDLPQVKIVQEAFTLPPFGGSSTTVEFSQSYRVLFATDALRVVPLNQLKYQAIRALVKAGPGLGLPFARGYEVGTGRDDTKSPPEEVQKSQRWLAAFTITVHLYMSRHFLAAS